MRGRVGLVREDGMRFKAAVSGVVAALAVAAPARAVTLVTPDGAALGGHLQAVADGSRVPTAPGTVVVDLSPCPGTAYQGCWTPEGLHIPTARGVDVRWTLMHELGHVFDERILRGADRAAFKRVIRYSGAWATGAEPAGERFAEAYAGCAIYAGAPYGGLDAEYGYSAGPETFARVCALIRRAAARYHPPYANQPPSTATSLPVTKDASSDARKATTRAISAGSA
jgi:hypothetical protein